MLCDIVVADGLRTGLRPDFGGPEPDDVWKMRAEVWRDPRAIIGGSDAGAHLDMMSGASYSTFVVGDAVRNGYVTIEEAVHLLTDVPARLYGVRDRGRLAVGAHADLVIFDPATVGPAGERTYDDLPGGASRIVAESRGMQHVLVAGTEIVRDGAYTGATPGTVLRVRPRHRDRLCQDHDQGALMYSDATATDDAAAAPDLEMNMFSQRLREHAARGVPRGARDVPRDAQRGNVRARRVRDALRGRAVGAASNPEVFSSKDVVKIGNDVPLLPLSVDPPDHAKYRRLLDPQFSPKRMAELEPEARKLVNEIIDGFASRGECEFHDEFATPLPSTIFLALMGLPQDDLPDFLRWRDDTIRPEADDVRGGPGEARGRRARRSSDYFEHAIEEKRATPTTGCSARSCTARSTAAR